MAVLAEMKGADYELSFCLVCDRTTLWRFRYEDSDYSCTEHENEDDQ
jgi:hypothetical protein